MKVFVNPWTLVEVDNLSIDALEKAFDAGNLEPLLINDGRIVGCKKTETPAAGTVGESM